MFNGCSDDNYRQLAVDGFNALMTAVETFVSNGNWIVKTAVAAGLAALLLDLIIPGDPVPIFPLGVQESDGEQAQNVSMNYATGW